MRKFGLYLIWMGLGFGYVMLWAVMRRPDPVGIGVIVFCGVTALVGFVLFRCPRKP